MEPKRAEELYDQFVEALAKAGVERIGTGVFRATMDVELVNDGPVTILLDSKKQF